VVICVGTLAIGEERLGVVGVPVTALGVATRDAAGDEGAGVWGAGLQGRGTLGERGYVDIVGWLIQDTGYRITSDPGKLQWGGCERNREDLGWVQIR